MQHSEFIKLAVVSKTLSVGQKLRATQAALNKVRPTNSGTATGSGVSGHGTWVGDKLRATQAGINQNRAAAAAKPSDEISTAASFWKGLKEAPTAAKVGLGTAGGLTGGWALGNNQGYERGNERGFETGFGGGYNHGFETAGQQAGNTGFLSRLFGKFNFDPEAGLQGLNEEALQGMRLDNRAGFMNRSGRYVPFYG